MPEGQYFRAGVGAIIRRPDDRILVLERADIPGAWQLPQGGLEEGEEPFEAILREIAEETGIPPGSLTLVGQYPEPLAYELPPEDRSAKTGRGQVQYWFLFDYSGTAAMALPVGGEFRAWRWAPFDELVSNVVAFRKPLYETLAAYPEWRLVPRR